MQAINQQETHFHQKCMFGKLTTGKEKKKKPTKIALLHFQTASRKPFSAGISQDARPILLGLCAQAVPASEESGRHTQGPARAPSPLLVGGNRSRHRSSPVMPKRPHL